MVKRATVSLKEMTKEKDAFVHASAVKAADMRYLNEGDKLEFTLEDGPKGPSAVNLKKID
jgi:CspA family cold shock protein